MNRYVIIALLVLAPLATDEIRRGLNGPDQDTGVISPTFVSGVGATLSATVIPTVKMKFDCYGNGPLDSVPGCSSSLIRDKLKSIGCKTEFVGTSGGKNTRRQKTSDGRVWGYLSETTVHSSNCYPAPGAGDACRDRNARSTHVQTRKGTMGENTMICVCDISKYPLKVCDASAK